MSSGSSPSFRAGLYAMLATAVGIFALHRAGLTSGWRQTLEGWGCRDSA